MTAPISVSMTLPYPPSNNTYYRHIVVGKSPRTLLSKEGRLYREAVAAFVLERQAGQVEGRIALFADVHPPDKRRRDLDNVLKALLDSLTYAGVIRDDSDIDSLTVRRMEVRPGGEVKVVVYTMDNDIVNG